MSWHGLLGCRSGTVRYYDQIALLRPSRGSEGTGSMTMTTFVGSTGSACGLDEPDWDLRHVMLHHRDLRDDQIGVARDCVDDCLGC